jgi:hypothetical protein
MVTCARAHRHAQYRYVTYATLSCWDASRLRREPRSVALSRDRWDCEVAANAKDRSDLHSRKGAYALQRHDIPGVPQDRRRIRQRRCVPVGMASQRPIAVGCRVQIGKALRLKISIPPHPSYIRGRMSGKRRSFTSRPKLGIPQPERAHPDAGSRRRRCLQITLACARWYEQFAQSRPSRVQKRTRQYVVRRHARRSLIVFFSWR